MKNSFHGKKLLPESILEWLLFHTFLCDLLLFTNDTNIANYADKNTTYTSESTIYQIVEWLEECSGDVLTWLENYIMKANPQKMSPSF